MGAAIAVEDRAYPPSATRSLSVTLRIAPARAGAGRNTNSSDSPPFQSLGVQGGEDVPFAGFCSLRFWSLQEVLPESSRPHPFSKHLPSVQVLETHLSQPPLPPPGKQ